MAISQVKLRMLYTMRFLLEKSDEKHTLSAADINCLLQGIWYVGGQKDCL